MKRITVAIRVIVWLINDALLGVGVGYIYKHTELSVFGKIIGVVVLAAVLLQRYFMIKDIEASYGKEN